ncbi:hypothetical protein Psi01_82920 [Planobispora siamensis]|uniref:IS30 family transposase n=1 Tax=Planobispora siamensis TaxID=936338 RepID=A0A8J3SRQ3_9ACTN|nr:hypothetical protein Psi01_82920 [Planobispora siamensis]
MAEARRTAGQFDEVAAQLNSRPRKILSWQTPAELFAKRVATVE